MKGLMHSYVRLWLHVFPEGGHIWITRQAPGVGMKRNSLLKSASFVADVAARKVFTFEGPFENTLELCWIMCSALRW